MKINIPSSSSDAAVGLLDGDNGDTGESGSDTKTSELQYIEKIKIQKQYDNSKINMNCLTHVNIQENILLRTYLGDDGSDDGSDEGSELMLIKDPLPLNELSA